MRCPAEFLHFREGFLPAVWNRVDKDLMAHVKGMKGFEAGFFPRKDVFCVVDSRKDSCCGAALHLGFVG